MGSATLALILAVATDTLSPGESMFASPNVAGLLAVVDATGRRLAVVGFIALAFSR